MAKILFIDDDQSIQEIVSLYLKDAGHMVHSTLTGAEGIKFASVDRPDLILLDMALPEMDGIEVIRTLKADPATANIPVVVLTVHDREDMPASLDQQDIVGYLQKPVAMKALQDAVNEALDRHTAKH
ncbi:MAG: response regulator [Sphingomonadales bacterium]|nr:response regulator [Sphingomonadales bacterium]